MTVIRFGYGIKPEFLEVKVFVVYAAYLQTSEFRTITNNISEEICGITLILGMFFLAFAKLRNESEEISKSLPIRSCVLRRTGKTFQE